MTGLLEAYCHSKIQVMLNDIDASIESDVADSIGRLGFIRVSIFYTYLRDHSIKMVSDKRAKKYH